MAFDLLPVPDSLKVLTPYIQRSIELEKKAPIVGYYCRSYAAQRGVQELQREDHPRDQASEKYLFGLMDFLEGEKAKLSPDPEDGKVTVTTLAVKIFKKADEAEKKGQINQRTAKLFYVSTILFETATQFGELEENMAQLYQYGRYKAAEVKKVLKGDEEKQEDDLERLKNELNQPLPQQEEPQKSFQTPQEPQQMQQDDDFEKLQQQFLQQSQQFDNPQTNNTSTFDSSFQTPQEPQQTYQPPQQTYQPPQQPQQTYQPPQQPQQTYQPPPQQQQQPQQPQQQKSPRNQDSTFGGYRDDYVPPSTSVSDDDVVQAQKFAKYAISSLSFDDVPAAIDNLKKALAHLER